MTDTLEARKALVLDENHINTTFDALVERNIILYGEEEVRKVTDDGFDFEFRVCRSFLTKPGVPDNMPKTGSQPTFGPGSDIVEADPGLNVSMINKTHRLVLNRYCALRPQFLILTTDSYRRQTEQLDGADISAAWAGLHSLESDSMVIYNCGPKAGCSRLHKHLQMFSIPQGFKLFPDRADACSVPYNYYLSRLGEKQKNGTREPHEFFYSEYQRHVRDALDGTMGSITAREGYFPHNIVMTKRWLVLIPRREQAIECASANAAGMCGLVWVATRGQVEKWLDMGAAKILSELGLERNSQTQRQTH